jgi:putative endonuclease
MRKQKFFYVYVLVSSSRRAMYVGITDDMHDRLGRHKKASRKTFSGRYRTWRLVYFETFVFPSNAISREKEIKGWTRAKKEALVRTANPRWEDLAKDWGKEFKPTPRQVEKLSQIQDQPQGPSSAKRMPPQDDGQ